MSTEDLAALHRILTMHMQPDEDVSIGPFLSSAAELLVVVEQAVMWRSEHLPHLDQED